MAPKLGCESYELRASALAALGACIDRLRVASNQSDPSLADGLAGQALAWAELWSSGLCEDGRDRAIAHVGMLREHVAKSAMPPTLFGGLLGPIFAIDAVGRSIRDEEMCEIAAAALADLAEAYESWSDSPRVHYDLINGVVGALFAYSTVTGASKRVATVSRLQHALSVWPQADYGEGCWYTPPWFVPATIRSSYPQGYLDLGIAHGNGGVIAIVARLAESGLITDALASRARKCVQWLKDNARLINDTSVYPSFYAAGTRGSSSRIGWCYGDISLGFALLRYGIAFCDETSRSLGWELMRLGLRRMDASKSAVVESSLCHGAAGVLHLATRCKELGGGNWEDACGDAWLRRLLELRIGRGAGGFFTHRQVMPAGAPGSQVVLDDGFLNGVAGVALSIASAVAHPVSTGWDAVLLLR